MLRDAHPQARGMVNWNQAHLRASLKQGILAALFCVGSAGLVTAQGTAASDFEVKAAYLYNFAHSAQWPSASLPANNAPFVIGVVGGEKEFLDELRTLTDGRTVEAHPLVAKAVNTESEMRACQIVFFHATERRQVPAAVASLQSMPVLLVGEESSFLRQGGIINLYLQNGRIRFEVNRQALDRAGVRLSQALLQLAKAEDASKSSEATTRPLRYSEAPQYPELARRLFLTGTVHLEAVVKRDGTVKDVRVLGGSPVLADALSRAVMSWKYEPTARETVEQVEYTFTQ